MARAQAWVVRRSDCARSTLVARPYSASPQAAFAAVGRSFMRSEVCNGNRTYNRGDYSNERRSGLPLGLCVCVGWEHASLRSTKHVFVPLPLPCRCPLSRRSPDALPGILGSTHTQVCGFVPLSVVVQPPLSSFVGSHSARDTGRTAKMQQTSQMHVSQRCCKTSSAGACAYACGRLAVFGCECRPGSVCSWAKPHAGNGAHRSGGHGWRQQGSAAPRPLRSASKFVGRALYFLSGGPRGGALLPRPRLSPNGQRRPWAPCSVGSRPCAARAFVA